MRSDAPAPPGAARSGPASPAGPVVQVTETAEVGRPVGPGGGGRRPRSTLRTVAVPVEHGGWGLTLEPVALGLLLAPSVAGFCIAAAALLAFVARTPLKVLLVDAHRGRLLDRTRVARLVLAGEGAVLAGLVAVPVLIAPPGFWVPVVVVGPLLAAELWFDMRSRGRRLVPELAGAMGIGGVAALIVLAGGGDGHLAVAAWLILAARAVTAIVTVRDQVGRLHGRPGHPLPLVAADIVALAMAGLAVAVDGPVAAGAGAILAAIVVQRVLGRRRTPRAVVLGLRQSALGLAVVVVTAAGVLAT